MSDAVDLPEPVAKAALDYPFAGPPERGRTLEVAPGVPAEISALIDQTLTKDRSQRIGTARELADRLEAAAAATQSGSFPAYTTKVPTLMPGPMGLRMGSNPAISTGGPWADAHPTQRMARAAQAQRRLQIVFQRRHQLAGGDEQLAR